MNEKEMSNEARQVRNAYQRKWRANNKDKVAEINRRYWERKASSAMKKRSAKESGRHE